ncbi:MAG: glycogen/starch synthase [Desulfobacterales bacterium]|nr:glycogen/starch synthase [Desulfobacterales bacterium]
MSIRKNPRVLVVTPEVTYLPDGMGNMANYMTAKAGGLADVSAALISALFQQGVDVHVALPDYRKLFNTNRSQVLGRTLGAIRDVMPGDRIHLAEDRAFYYLDNVYSNYSAENARIALAFQREVINNIIPRVKPDLIHCNDWMTGLVPAVSRQAGIPCLFTVHNIHSTRLSLAQIEDRGIDAAYFWQHLYYHQMAYEYEETRSTNPVDFLLSGVFAAHFVNTVSPSFLHEVAQGRHGFVEPPLERELANKVAAGCAVGILNAPDPSFDPEKDGALARPFGPKDHVAGKRANKKALQASTGLAIDDRAALFFWPHRLESIQKGCQLLADILYRMVHTYWDRGLQLVFVANGEYQPIFRNIVHFHGFADRVAICSFDENLARLAYGAADFVLMPSRFEPCGLPQMIGCCYGALPVAHDTGGIHDTVAALDVDAHRGNGFLFNVYDSNGLFWAVSQAMGFHERPAAVRAREVRRIMKESAAAFNHSVTARRYIDLYETMLDRPLVVPPPESGLQGEYTIK